MTMPPVAAPAGAPAVTTAPPSSYGAPRRPPDLTLIVGGLFTAATGVLLAGIGSRYSNIAYVVMAVLAGTVLYVRTPDGYVSFTLWLWFVTPFVRRVFDLHHGWNPASPVLIAPPAVALLSVLTILRRLSELRGVLYAPYLLVILAFAYGFAVGIINAGMVPAAYAFVTWVAPALFGLHVALSWRSYPEFANRVQRTFVWAVPILAAYGIYQFVRLPSWDAQWMVNADMRSIGAPRPFLVRVFGTLNTPGPFAAVLAAGALILLPAKGRFKAISVAIATVAMLLARTRAIWIAFIIGLITQQIGQPLRKSTKYVVTLVAVALMAVPLAQIPQFSKVIGARMATLTNLSEDNSFKKRYNFTEAAASSIVATAEGMGLGTTGGAIKLRGGQGVRALDNGFLEVFYIYGWVGGMLFFLGIAGLLLQAMRFRETRSDPFANAARAVSVSLIAILPIGDVFTGATGTLLWMAVGFGLSGHAYHLATGQALRSQAIRRAVLAARMPAAAPPVPVALLDRPARV
jgi:hypothetical protein